MLANVLLYGLDIWERDTKKEIINNTTAYLKSTKCCQQRPIF